MRKLLLTVATIALSSSALADESMFYFRADVGASFLPEKTYNAQKGKRTNHIVGALGVGSYLMDNLRTEFVLSNHFSPSQNYKAVGYSEKVKFKIMSLSLKGLVDFYEFGSGKAFAGLGLGYSKISAKGYGVTKSAVGYKSKAANKGNLSYLITAGVGFDVADGVIADLTYSFNDYGSTKELSTFYSNNTSSIDGKVHLRSHDITAGIRFDL